MQGIFDDGDGLNRTIVELKHLFDKRPENRPDRLNRTIVELKRQ